MLRLGTLSVLLAVLVGCADTPPAGTSAEAREIKRERDELHAQIDLMKKQVQRGETHVKK
ncbi:hypothetical protein [Sphingomonas sp.]|uniref:hypothetical protein n=1 Tax=Sphingomonas sp. TaxID=28214 RepID=UPI002869ED18|nr:hypothetical protein [Sphingomonas sp.]